MSQSINQSIKRVILSTFAADSFSLGAHWEYDASIIAQKYGRLFDVSSPISAYHQNKAADKAANKAAGDLTHIGQNALLLIDVLADQSINQSNFLAVNLQETVDVYLDKWQTVWDVPDDRLIGYKDHATKERLKHLKDGKKGVDASTDDDDMSHALRWFPLISVLKEEESLVQGAKLITSNFQSSVNQSIVAEFFARTFYRVMYLHQSPIDAINSSANHIDSAWLNERIAHGQKLSDEYSHDSLTALQSLGPVKEYSGKKIYTGLACGSENGVPAVIYHIQQASKFASKQPSEWIIDTVNAGGNSNARAIALALILFAQQRSEPDQVMQGWIEKLNSKTQIENALNKILQ